MLEFIEKIKDSIWNLIPITQVEQDILKTSSIKFNH